MKFKLWKEYGAQNAKPIFDAFEHSCIANGHNIISDHSIDAADCHVIWSVLFHGRMARNKDIWTRCHELRKPVIVLEVGGIKRGTTWKVGLNGINRDANFGTMGNNADRAVSLGLSLKPWRSQGDHVLICGQHDKSLQWQNMPRMSEWVMNTIDTLQQYTDKPIVFRPHPRCQLPDIERQYQNVYRDQPEKISGSYDDYNLSFHKTDAVISWSSNPGPHAVLTGTKVFTGPSSLAYPMSIESLSQINQTHCPDRQQWLNDYAWTEYTIEEIMQGIPLNRLTNHL